MMKIKLGFISNSSSASYYITILEPPVEALKTIAENCWYPYIDIDEMQPKIDTIIIGTEKRLEDLENKKESFIFETKSFLEKKLTKFKKFKEDIIRIQKDRGTTDGVYYANQIVLLKIAFDLSDIDLHENHIELQLSSSSSMHNNYTEGMPAFLQDIVLYYTFEKKDKILLKVDHDG